jgi:hypothetical protein
MLGYTNILIRDARDPVRELQDTLNAVTPFFVEDIKCLRFVQISHRAEGGWVRLAFPIPATPEKAGGAFPLMTLNWPLPGPKPAKDQWVDKPPKARHLERSVVNHLLLQFPGKGFWERGISSRSLPFAFLQRSLLYLF